MPKKPLPKLDPRLFWDVKYPTQNEFITHAFFIIERVLMKGGLVDFWQIYNFYDLKQIQEVVIKSRQIDNKTHTFFAIIANLNLKNICYPKQLNPELWNY